ncbi:DUF885 domain-containing protein [Phenylobacterium sp.]|uniref:DUF885 domain-containing protein n=1 Tax=Phenylobacterium sp. TaxID=1871053 RepID=UPI002C2523D8|nr:DUF885 family protein [Phenylobacterium sp.]HVI31937.1 DUF885 family protein [Phenylobacterium sp.]
MRRLVLALVLVLLAGPAFAQESAVTRVIADYEAFWLADDPITAGRLGDRAALSKLPDVTPAADARRKAALEGFQGRLKAIPDAGLSAEAKLNRDLLAWIVDSQLQGLAFDTARMPLSSDGGFYDTLGYLAQTTPIRSAGDARAWVDRLEAAPKSWRDNIENTRRGVKTRFTQPRSSVEVVLKQMRETVATPVDQDPLLQPLARLPDSVPAAEQAALRARGRAAVAALRPIQREFITFLEREYLPAARPQLGARTLPDGERYYRWLVRDHTTTDLSPDQIHELGRAEVARIRAEMDGVMKAAGWTGDLAGFIAMLRKDPRFYATSREDLLEKASEIAKRIDDRLPGWFGTLPRLTYGVRPVPQEIEQAYTTGRYFQGSPAQGVAGGYMVNTYALDQRALYELPALTAHEAVPGHHLQIALAQELEGKPAFRREAPAFTAFVEGWGLYSERVAGEMGIYRTPYERFGQLSYEMWRACRLVADTGIHWKGWSLDQARACFTENTALSPLNIEVELARYVSWPGQALAYKVGERKYVELRERATKALGPRFDVRRFHDAVLLAGPLPMDVLDRRITDWIAAEQAR